MVNLNAALDRCGIHMREAFVPERLGETMDVYFARTLENHQRSTDVATLFSREGDIAGLVREACKVSKTEQTSVSGIDGLIFWGHTVLIINKHVCRSIPTWCRIFNKNQARTCCVCYEDLPRKSVCIVCQANVCRACDTKLESTNCPVCRTDIR